MQETPYSVKIPIGISTCLLGEEVRFDGGHKHDAYLMLQHTTSTRIRPN